MDVEIGASMGRAPSRQPRHGGFRRVSFCHKGGSGHAQGQEALGLPPGVDAAFLFGDAGVQNASQPVTIGMGLAFAQALQPVRLGQPGQTGGDQRDHLFMQHPRRPALAVADDMAIRRVEHVLHPRHLQRAAVQAGIVERAVIDQHGSVADRPVQHCRRQVVIAKHARLPARAEHNGQAGLGCCMGAQGGDQFAFTCGLIQRCGGGQINPTGQKVDMGILKAGQHQPAPRVNPMQSVRRHTPAQRGNPAIADQQPFGIRRGGVHRADAGVVDKGFGHGLSGSDMGTGCGVAPIFGTGSPISRSITAGSRPSWAEAMR